jgi:quercetin dioxygenase-like cupin family protein
MLVDGRLIYQDINSILAPGVRETTDTLWDLAVNAGEDFRDTVFITIPRLKLKHFSFLFSRIFSIKIISCKKNISGFPEHRTGDHMIIRSLNAIPVEKVSVGKNSFRQVLIGSDEAPNFAMRRFIIEPEGEIPNHTNTVEHEQLVLSGRAEIGIGDEIFEVSKNDVVFIPAYVPHRYRTIGDDAFEFLCMVPNREDIIKIIEPKRRNLGR